MKYVFLLIFMALIFGLCWVVDRICKSIAARHPKPEKVVRLPRRELIFGILLTFFSVAVIVGFLMELPVGFRIGIFVVLAMGLYLLVHYLSFGLWYDNNGFVYRDLTHRARRYAYADIEAQQSFLTRSGVTTTLYLKDGEIGLYEAMVGLQEFLPKAFDRWCEARNVDPESVENNPSMLTYFPQKDAKNSTR